MSVQDPMVSSRAATADVGADAADGGSGRGGHVADTIAVDGGSAVAGSVQFELESTPATWRTRFLGRPIRKPFWLLEVLLCWGLYRFYGSIRNNVGDVRDQAYANARAILRFEDALGLSWERPLNSITRHSDLLSAIMSVHYATFHLHLTPIVLVWVYLRRPTYARFAAGVWITTTFFALIGFYLMPTAPPRLLPSEGFVDVMRQTSSWGWWPASGAPGSQTLANQFAAMPSLHCAWAAWCGVTVFYLVKRTWVRVLAVLYPLVTFVSVMATGNHYLLDVVGGVGLLAFVGGSAVLLVGKFRTWRLIVSTRVSASA